MKPTVTVAFLSIMLWLTSCATQPTQPPCTTELSPIVTPTNINLLPEETAQPSFKVLSCGGKLELGVTPRWVSADPSVATVDASSGLITAQLVGGNTKITVSEEEYGTKATVTVNVAVVDPVPR